MPGPDDPQYDVALPMPPVPEVIAIEEGRALEVGSLSLTPFITAGHTPGGTTWTWRSCEGERCVDFVYADSQTPISADGFMFSSNAHYPTAVEDFQRGFEILERPHEDRLRRPQLRGPRARARQRRAGAAAAVPEAAIVAHRRWRRHRVAAGLGTRRARGGDRCRHRPPRAARRGAEAAACIAGYAPLNDVTARDLQTLDVQFTRAKGFDTFCPVGDVVSRPATGVTGSHRRG
jgi:hypothetical protein